MKYLDVWKEMGECVIAKRRVGRSAFITHSFRLQWRALRPLIMFALMEIRQILHFKILFIMMTKVIFSRY